MDNGPPESPLQLPPPSVVSMQTTPSFMWPQKVSHSDWDITRRSSTYLKTGLIPPAESEGFPHPLTKDI